MSREKLSRTVMNSGFGYAELDDIRRRVQIAPYPYRSGNNVFDSPMDSAYLRVSKPEGRNDTEGSYVGGAE